MFEIKKRDAAGRICTFQTKHGSVQTPALMPVVNPHQMVLSPRELRKAGAQIIITNSYIIHQDLRLREAAQKKGLHSLLDFDGPVMTDSGSFQSYLYGSKIDPIEIVQFQRDIGSDIGTIYDIISSPSASFAASQTEITETVRRAQESIGVKGDMMLAGTIQGSIYPSLRQRCARKMGKLDIDFHPIGGVVPLMEMQRYSDIARIIISSKKGLPPSRPVHLFGAGHPLILPLAVALGCDFFDSSAYIKYAKDERLLFATCTKKLGEMEESPCSCGVCHRYSPRDLREMETEERIRNIALHNLYQTFAEMKKIREAIREGSLWEMVERRAVTNPYLLDAMEVVQGETQWLEKFEPISKKKAFFYTGQYSLHRPLVYRYHQRLFQRYIPSAKKIRVLPEKKKPYSRYYQKYVTGNTTILVSSPFGPVPIELDEMYPFSQSLFPQKLDMETQEMNKRLEQQFLDHLETLTGNLKISPKKERIDKKIYQLRKIKKVADMQFGKGTGNALFDGKIDILVSPRTGKIRSICVDKTLIASMRASDGLFILGKEGGHRLHKKLDFPDMRVIIDNEAIPFVQQGRNVFSKFVIDASDHIRPLDEVLIVSAKDDLVGTGTCLLNREELLSFTTGMGVKTRQGYAPGK